jgi:hypothetical protein
VLESYPLALVREAPGLVLVAAVAVSFRREAWARWGPLLGAGLAQIVALCAAEARGGAPTHHPERALAATFCLLGLVAAGEAGRLWRARAGAPGGGESGAFRASRVVATAALLAVVTLAGLAWRLRALPEGFGPDRAEELELGRALARRVGAGERVLVAPPSYGYLAALVTFGRPDDVTALVPRAVDPRSKAGDPFEGAASLARAVEQAGARWVLAAGGLRGGPIVGAWWLYDARGGEAR